MQIYHNPRCRKSREALALLEEAGVAVEIKEYLKEPPSKEELSDVLTKLNLKPFDLIRRGEAIFKEQFKGKDLSDEEWVDVMINNPKLIERPVVIKDDQAVVGRPPENVKALI